MPRGAASVLGGADWRTSSAEYAEAMTRLRLALAQVDPTVGDLRGNADLVVSWSVRAAEPGRTSCCSPRWS